MRRLCHELRNPVGGIKGHADLMMDEVKQLPAIRSRTFLVQLIEIIHNMLTLWKRFKGCLRLISGQRHS
jgi:nitrogen-specific signal transduction histidine kinase